MAAPRAREIPLRPEALQEGWWQAKPALPRSIWLPGAGLGLGSENAGEQGPAHVPIDKVSFKVLPA